MMQDVIANFMPIIIHATNKLTYRNYQDLSWNFLIWSFNTFENNPPLKVIKSSLLYIRGPWTVAVKGRRGHFIPEEPGTWICRHTNTAATSRVDWRGWILFILRETKKWIFKICGNFHNPISHLLDYLLKHWYFCKGLKMVLWYW